MERAFVHVDHEERDGLEHKVRGGPGAASSQQCPRTRHSHTCTPYTHHTALPLLTRLSLSHPSPVAHIPPLSPSPRIPQPSHA